MAPLLPLPLPASDASNIKFRGNRKMSPASVMNILVAIWRCEIYVNHSSRWPSINVTHTTYVFRFQKTYDSISTAAYRFKANRFWIGLLDKIML